MRSAGRRYHNPARYPCGDARLPARTTGGGRTAGEIAPPGSLPAMRGRGGGGRRSIRVPCQRLGWDRREARWLERERQGRGNEFPLPVGPSPRGDITTVQHMGRSRRRAGHGCSPDIASTDPAPSWAGEERRRRGRGGGCRQKRMGSLPPKAREGCRREVRWLERERQGRGNEFPLPVGPSPRGDITTVQCTGRSRRRAGHGGPPATPRIRFPTSSTPDTVFRRLHPGHGCSPGIATHGPCPRKGAGEERRRRGRGGGCRQKCTGIRRRRRRRRGGYRRGVWVSSVESNWSGVDKK